ncbi:MAG: hypothetical protein P1P59_09570, partial [Treponemataceae bacterium]
GNIAKLKEAIEKIRDLPASTIAPGFLYVRFPGCPLPYGANGVFNWTEEHEWRLVHEQYPGVFLRLAGGNASSFKADSESVSYDTKAKGTGGGQMDAVQEHKHNISCQDGYGGINYNDIRGDEDPGKGSITRTTNHPHECRSDIETRPKNITVEMYVYEPRN